MERLVVTVFEHSLWGYIIQPVWVKEEDSESLTILENADKNSSYFKALSLIEKEIVEISDKYSVKTLMKSFSKEKNVSDFQKKVTENTIQLYIRPTIERYQAQIINKLYESGLEVYLRESIKKRTLFDFNRIYIKEKPAEVIFNFEKNEESSLRYYISVKWDSEEIDLAQKFYAILNSDPATILLDDKLLVFDDIDAKKLQPFFTKKFIEVPATSEKAYIEKFVVNCIKKYEVKSNGLNIEEIKPDFNALVSLRNGWDMLPELCVEFQYGDKIYPYDATDNRIVFAKEINGEIFINWFYRDKNREMRFEQLLVEGGLHKVNINNFRITGKNNETNIDDLINWIRLNPEIMRHFIFTQDIEDKRYFLGEIHINNTIEEKQDWFDIKSEAAFGDFKIPFIRFKNHILNNVKEYILPDGSIAILPEEWFSRYHELMFFGSKDGDNIRLRKYHFKIKDTISFDDQKNYSSMQLYSESEIPKGIQATMRPYQQKGFSWLVYLYENKLGGVLADDMGLGKTLQTISLLQKIHLLRNQQKQKGKLAGQLSFFEEDNLSVYESADCPPSLIVVPTSLSHNWFNELKKFTPSQKVYLYSGEKRIKTKDLDKFFRMFDVIITTYGVLRGDIEILATCHFHHLVLDESQYVKNPNSQTYKAVKQIDSKYKLALTGTPIENSLSDLWAQFNIINEGMLGSHAAFQKTYINPIVNRNNKEKEEALLRIIQPFILRRTKQEVTPELPPLTEEVIYCDMSHDQKVSYDKEKSRLRNSLIGADTVFDPKKITFLTLQGLTRLRLTANHPVFTDPSYTGDSGKFEQVMMYLEGLRSNRHKVLVFSSFVKHLRLFAKYFDEKKWQYAWLTGNVSVQEREKQIRMYMTEKDVNCFFISLKAGGVGLNLTAADYVFILDPWWNPAAEMQAISRSHRIGQDKNVMVYRFISSDSIEEKIRSLQESKSKLADQFVSSSNPLANMNKEDIEQLLK